MDKDQSAEIKRLKQDFFKLEQESNQEKECLLKVINSFGMVMATHGEFAEEFQAIKKSVNTDTALPVDLIEKEIGTLRSKIFTILFFDIISQIVYVAHFRDFATLH